mmetsp:Transcript_60813/g.125278  ORF Transcript_60813/g.125278 Transcript_60813/m.125278 type:complete len:295 (-) Transcript_60813:1154-2038(-)
MSLQRVEGLLDLSAEGALVVDERNELRVVEPLQQHACDLARKLPLFALDQVVQALSEDLLRLRGGRVHEVLHELVLGHLAGGDGGGRGLCRRRLGTLLRRLLLHRLLRHRARLLPGLHHASLRLSRATLLLLPAGTRALLLLPTLPARALRVGVVATRVLATALLVGAAHVLLLRALPVLLLALSHGGLSHRGPAEHRRGAGTAAREAHVHGRDGHGARHLEAREHLLRALALRRLHLAADLDGLVEGHVNGLGADHLAVHGRHGARRLLGLRKAHKAEALRHLGPVLVAHHLR